MFKIIALLLLVVLLETLGTSAEVSPLSTDLECSPDPMSEVGTTDGCDTLTVTPVKVKPFNGKSKSPIVVENTSGFLNRTCQSTFAFGEQQPWRILCPRASTLFTIIMSLHLAPNDYLQVKKLKLNGTVENKFHALYFSKRSILVGLVGGNHVFSYQSTFMMAYVCVSHDSKKNAEAYLMDEIILSYLHCRPQALDKVFQLIVKPVSILDSDPDINYINALRFKTTLPEKLPCINDEPVPTDDLSSGEGSTD